MLLNCNEGEEWELLEKHSELLDTYFIQVMQKVAEELEKKGDEKGADFLRNLADKLVYQDIIAQLLDCASDEEVWQVLDANRDWVDKGLTQTMLEVTEDLKTRGDLDKSNFLMSILEQLMGVHGNTSDAQLNFLLKVLQAIAESGGDAQKVYLLLAENIDKVDDRLVELLQSWATTTLEEARDVRENKVPLLQSLLLAFNWVIGKLFKRKSPKLDEVEYIAADISDFSSTIAQFPLGDKASNMEIAITGYKIALTIYTSDAFPDEWATTQTNLGNAYFNRIRGERAENLEQAIACCQEALKVYTVEAFPQDWAGTQTNLGDAYCNRIRGERAEIIGMKN